MCLYMYGFVSLLFSLEALAQPRRDVGVADGRSAVRPLQVGDTIPGELWHLPLQVVNHPEGKDTVRLSDYRDRELIILDFWATWCASCIRFFPKIDSLNRTSDRGLAVFPVTNQSYGHVVPWLRARDIALSSVHIVGDSEETGLGGYFPKKILPHVAVLGRGRVLAITGPESLTTGNISAWLHGAAPEVRAKRDSMGFDIRKPLFVGDPDSRENGFTARSIFCRRLDGVASQFLIHRDTKQRRIAYKLINGTFKNAWTAVFSEALRFRPNQIIYPEEDRELMDSVFTYELILPLDRAAGAPSKIRQDLETYFGYTAALETRNVPTWVLSGIPPSAGVAVTGHRFAVPVDLSGLAGQTAESLVYLLNTSGPDGHFAKNEAGGRLLPAEVPQAPVASLDALNQWLKQENLRLSLQYSDVKYLVIKKI